jgi:transketolase
VVVEAGIEMGWASVAGPDFSFIGMNSFGASAPAAELFRHFGITKEAVIAAALAKLK